ncbi:signal peptidase I [Photobacterium kishitanii]|uniref:Signal peptidase I n=1 Tax=Photobacterium kishitanii TaxID=318456 RepID=A0A2T3KML5_9GAMM|nr:signal peptidase I [Photobacterium kishitanii]PSV01043.1 signal peptidase I [Photobacterium kishitanii]
MNLEKKREYVKTSLFIAAILLIKFVVIDMYKIPSGSMIPTLNIHDRVLVNQLAYSLRIPGTEYHIAKISEPKRGDVVVFYEHNSGDIYIKRVMAIGGDKVSQIGEQIYINDKPLKTKKVSYPNLTSQFDYFNEQNGGKSYIIQYNKNVSNWFNYINIYRHGDFGTKKEQRKIRYSNWVVPYGKLFMMGDNRDNSKDSRFLKGSFISIDQVIGKAIAVPFNLSPLNLQSRNGIEFIPRLTKANTGLYTV